jgi:hypothetical protein
MSIFQLAVLLVLLDTIYILTKMLVSLVVRELLSVRGSQLFCQ